MAALTVVAAVLMGTIVMASSLPFASQVGPVFEEPTGRVFFVSADGDNTNSGLSMDAPFRTLLHATSQLQVGDMLLVSDRGGPFGGGDRFVNALGRPSGTAERPVVIRAIDGETPVITAKPPQGAGQSLIALNNVHHVTIEGLTFIDTGFVDQAIQGPPPPTTNITISISGNSTHINILNNVFVNQQNVDFGHNPRRGSANHLVVWGGSDMVIRGNYFNASGGQLVQSAAVPNAAGAVDMVQIQGTSNLLIEHNFFGNAGHAALAIHDNVVGSAPAARSENVIVQFNTIANAWGGGIYFGRSWGEGARTDPTRPGTRPGDGGFTGHHVIQNNTIYLIGHQVNYPKAAINPTGNEGAIIRNNIIAYGGDYFGVVTSPLYMTSFLAPEGLVTQTRHRFFNNVTFRNGASSVYIAEGNSIIRDNEFKNNIMFEDNAPNFHRNLPAQQLDIRPAIVIAPHFAGRDPRTGMTYDQLFVDHFPLTNRFVHNIIVAPDNRAAEVQIWGTAAAGGLQNMTLAQAQNRFPLRDMAAGGFPGMMGGFAGNFESDPMFVRVSAPGDPKNIEYYDFRLQAGSPAINAGANLTYTRTAGTNTRYINVEDALYFTCGLGMIPGDPIIVGDNDIVRVVAVNYRYGILTVCSPISYGLGAAVNLPFNDTAPDIGAFQFAANPEILVDTQNINRTAGHLEILGIITSDWGQNVMLRVRNSTGDTVHVAQTTSMNSGSFQFIVPFTAAGDYTITISGPNVRTPLTLDFTW